MEFPFDNQWLWNTASTDASCAAALMWTETTPLSEPIPTKPETVSSELQSIFDWSQYAYPSEDPSTFDWSQWMAFSIQPLNQGLFQTPSPGSTSRQAVSSLGPEERSTSCGVSASPTGSPHSSSQLSSPQTAYANSMYRESPQHCYILSNNFLSPDQARQRTLLQHCLQSHWLNSEEIEPNETPRRSILLGFLAQNTPKAAFRCEFDGCGKGFSRQDRALGHIRMHLCHRPYACNFQCGNSACNERFSCRSYLQSHLTRQKDKCVNCGKAFLRQNMRRHNGTCLGSSGHS